MTSNPSAADPSGRSSGAVSGNSSGERATDGAACVAGVSSLVRREFRTLVLAGAMINLLVLASPIYMLQIYDRVLGSGHVETLVFITAIVLFAVLIYGLLEGVRSKILARLGFAVEALMRTPVLESMLAGARGDRRTPAAHMSDLGLVRSFLQSPGPSALTDMPWLPIFLVVLFLLHPLLGLVGVAAALLLAALALLNEWLARAPLREAHAVRAGAGEMLGSALTSADAIAAMGLRDAVARRYAEAVDKSATTELTASDRSASITAAIKALRMAAQVVVLGAGAWLVLGNEITAGAMIAASIVLGRAIAPVEHAVGSWKHVLAARDAWRRVKDALASHRSKSHEVALPRPSGSVALAEVRVEAGPGRPPVLDDVTLALAPGEICVVVGHSGSGKTTLCRAIVGAIGPDAGSVRIDGVEVRNWDEVDRGRYIGYLPQEVDVLAGSVAQNIARLGDQSGEAVLAAARLAQVHELVLTMPEGYETRVGAGGHRLSGGQRQRIGLARALYGRPPLVVLDEPNSNLDHEGERALIAAIRALKAEGTTVVMVLHRNEFLSLADKILVLAGGRVQFFGTPEQAAEDAARKRASLHAVGAGTSRPAKPAQAAE